MSLCWVLFLLLAGLTHAQAEAPGLVVPADGFDAQHADLLHAEDLHVAALALDNGWRYRAGHSQAWAARDFDDSGWAELDSLDTRLHAATRSRIDWDGKGWFRLRILVDQKLPDHPIALLFAHKGAAEIYFDGRLLYTTGQLAGPHIAERANFALLVGDAIPLPLVPGAEHVLALRYANGSYLGLLDAPDDSGFVASLVDAGRWDQWLHHFLRKRTMHQTLAVVPLAFALVHLLLFARQLQRPAHLFLAAFCLSSALLIYAPLRLYLTVTALQWTVWLLVLKWSIVAAPLSLLWLLYHEFRDGPYRLFRWECVVAGLAAVFALMLPLSVMYWVGGLLAVDLLRVVTLGTRRGPADAGIVRAGWFFFIAGCIWQALLPAPTLEFYPCMYGMLLLLLCLSVHVWHDETRAPTLR